LGAGPPCPLGIEFEAGVTGPVRFWQQLKGDGPSAGGRVGKFSRSSTVVGAFLRHGGRGHALVRAFQSEPGAFSDERGIDQVGLFPE